MIAQTMRRVVVPIGFLLATHSSTVRAESPVVAFDFARSAACRDVTPGEISNGESGERIMELALRVSVHLLAGNIDDVDEVRIEISDCDRRLRVHSFAPETLLESSLAQNVEWTRTVEHGTSLGASLGGELPVPLGDVVAHVTPSASGGITNRQITTEKQSRIPPKETIVASGTISQAHGVFFKLRRSPQSSLEGEHEFVVRFVVPPGWRGDAVRVCCQATGREKFLWTSQQVRWTHQCAPVAIYAAGDQEAKQAAQQFTALDRRS